MEMHLGTQVGIKMSLLAWLGEQALVAGNTYLWVVVLAAVQISEIL
jgi:hypothetical protein